MMQKLHTHYDNLKVARDAPDIVIRAAYRSLTQKYHPDKNANDERAARVMSILNQSYEVLADPAQRREHDLWIAREESKRSQQSAQAREVPIPPQWRKQAPAPPPRVPQRSALSKVLMFPLVLIVRVAAAVPQLAIGAVIFGAVWLWATFTPDKPPPLGPKPYAAQAPTAQEAPAPSISEASDCKVIRSDVNGTPTLYRYRKDGALHYTSKGLPAGCEVAQQSAARPIQDASERYVRPSTAPNGSAWPTRAGYVRDYPVDQDDGYSSITVDNSQNDADVFVKLVSLDGSSAFPTRQFFIPGGSQFRLNEVSAGKYDIRYRDLASGGLSRSEAFDVDELHTDEGVSYSTITMTLYKVAHGNSQTFRLAEAEF